MKKRYLLLVPFMMIGLVLGSCSSNIKYEDNNKTSSTTSDDDYLLSDLGISTSNQSIPNQTTELLYEPVYNDIDISLEKTSDASTSTIIEDVVENVYDSVVSIEATSTSSISSGSAVLFAKDNTLGFSYLLTCFHVIEGAYSFSITESDGDIYDAYLVAGYEDEDLAIMAIETPEEDDLCYATLFENSDELRLGSQVICIGNPLGTLPGSVSVGVVSYVNRTVSVSTYKKQTLIQTDVAINSGNSGGGLFNTSGALIGIVSAKYSSSGIEGLGFAIPSNTFNDVISKLMATAKYDSANKVWKTGYYEGDYEFGFTISLGTYRSNNSFKSVLYISALNTKESYTGEGLEVNDIISSVSIDYSVTTKEDSTLASISSVDDIMSYLYNSGLEVGDKIVFEVYRSNTKKTITIDVLQFRYSI